MCVLYVMYIYICVASGVINYSNELCWTYIYKKIVHITGLLCRVPGQVEIKIQTHIYTTQMDEYANKSINIMVSKHIYIEGRSMCVVRLYVDAVNGMKRHQSIFHCGFG